MKRILASILLLVYFTVSTGFIVSMHYCMGQLDSTQLGYSTDDTCGKCGMETSEPNGCCRDEFKVVKLQADQQVAKYQIADFRMPVLLPQTITLFLPPSSEFSGIIYKPEHGPPFTSGQEICLQNCVFRI
jgi:hypothetical protein